MIDPRDRELVNVLQQLQPAPMRTSREQIWYRAGLEAGRRRVKVWRGVAAVMMLAAGAAMWARLGARGTAERPVLVRQEVPVVVGVESEEERASAAAYYRLRDTVAQDGLAGLPRVEGGNGGAAPSAPRGWPMEF